VTAREGLPELTRDYAMFDLLRRPGVGFDELSRWHGGSNAVSRETLRGELGRTLADQVIGSIETSARYAGYLGKQHEEVERNRLADDVALPPSLDYAAVRALSFEARQVLGRHRPETIGQAARLPGITPAAISLLLVHLKKLRRGDAAANDGGALRASA
jgi:tRNA uridine 5-carboxymethylaminomethyl modification enzyme